MNTPNRTAALARGGGISTIMAHSASAGIPIFLSIVPPSVLLDGSRRFLSFNEDIKAPSRSEGVRSCTGGWYGRARLKRGRRHKTSHGRRFRPQRDALARR